MDVVPIVDRAYGMPVRAATRATAGSPSVCIIRVNPVGAKTSGALDGRPEDRRRGVHGRDVPEHLRQELDPCVRLPGTSQRDLLPAAPSA